MADPDAPAQHARPNLCWGDQKPRGVVFSERKFAHLHLCVRSSVLATQVLTASEAISVPRPRSSELGSMILAPRPPRHLATRVCRMRARSLPLSLLSPPWPLSSRDVTTTFDSPRSSHKQNLSPFL